LALALAGGDDQVFADLVDGFAGGAAPQQGVDHVLEPVSISDPSLANYARRQIDVAHEGITRMSQLFPAEVAQTVQEALRLLTVAADAWVAGIEGRGFALDNFREHLDDARKLIADFQTQARQAMESIPTSPQPSRSEADP
jgi:hypothetical protein